MSSFDGNLPVFEEAELEVGVILPQDKDLCCETHVGSVSSSRYLRLWFCHPHQAAFSNFYLP